MCLLTDTQHHPLGLLGFDVDENDLHQVPQLVVGPEQLHGQAGAKVPRVGGWAVGATAAAVQGSTQAGRVAGARPCTPVQCQNTYMHT